MQEGFLEHLYFLLYGDENDSEKTRTYRKKCHKAAEKYANPECSEKEVSNEFSEVLGLLCASEQISGFQRGICFAIKTCFEILSTEVSDNE